MDLADGVLRLVGPLDAAHLAEVWSRALELAGQSPKTIDLSGVTRLDGAGAALVAELRARTGKAPQGLDERYASLFKLYDPEALNKGEPPRARPGLVETVGRAGEAVVRDMRAQVTFLGEGSLALVHSLRTPHRIRWGDVFSLAERAGVNALPIIFLVGALMGLVMAFQSAVPLKRFGADVFVADLLAISMLRELGPLTTAILLAGRSGAAFAAEIGTMKVNEEVDALTTMGLSPLRFLAVPRILAAAFVMPVLTMFFNLFALIGGAVVVTGFGYSVTTYTSRVLGAVTEGDLVGGLFKAVVFALLVAGIGCQRGLVTGKGASAVGDSATSAVVSGIILIAVADGIFAVAFYVLGI